MPLAMCQGGCNRMISISNIPGGNPEALAHPESFAIHYVACRACGRMYCDRCAPAQAACACGQPLAPETAKDRERHYDAGSRAIARLTTWPPPQALATAAATAGGSTGQPRFLSAPPIDATQARARDLFRRAVAEARATRFERAVQLLDESLELDGRNPDALAYRGWIRALMAKDDEARADLEAALGVAPPGWPPRADVETDLAEYARRGT